MSKKLPPIHPGEILLEEFLKPLDMNPHQLAMALRMNLQSSYDLRAAAREHQAQIERDVQPRAE